MSLPSLEAASEALKYDPTKTGLIHLGEEMASWRVKRPQELHKAPEEFSILSMQELAKLRVEKLKIILEKWSIDLESESAGSLMTAVRNNAREIVSHLTRENAPEWTSRWNTRTMTLIDMNGNAQIIDATEEKFRDSHLVDYSTVSKESDGGAKIRENEDIGEVVGVIEKKVYQNEEITGGGNRSLDELMNHPVVQALFPDEILRAEYLASLGVVDMLQPFESGSQSIWVPHSMQPWFMRWHAAGFKADAFYPPNLTTLYFNLLMRSK